MMNDKAKIDWSSEGTSQPAENLNGKKWGEDNVGGQERGADLRSSPSNQAHGQGRKSVVGSRKHFVDRDTDISYYETSFDGVERMSGSSSSFQAISSENCFLAFKYFHYLPFCCVIFIYYFKTYET